VVRDEDDKKMLSPVEQSALYAGVYCKLDVKICKFDAPYIDMITKINEW
jgi:hypothetical protein